jgi:hypothetical protein
MLEFDPFKPFVVFATSIVQCTLCPWKFLRKDSKPDKYHYPTWAWVRYHDDASDKYNTADNAYERPKDWAWKSIS